MPVPTPDPVNEVMSSGAGHLGWPDFATISVALTTVAALLWKILGKHKEDAPAAPEPQSSSVELELLRSKISQLRTLAEDLDERYTELKKEIRSLEETIEDNDKDTSRSIKKLETDIEDLKRRMDKIIELILKLLSEQ